MHETRNGDSRFSNFCLTHDFTELGVTFPSVSISCLCRGIQFEDHPAVGIKIDGVPPFLLDMNRRWT